MQRIIRIITIFIVTLTISAAHAQSSQKAKNLLDQVTDKINSYNNIVFDFKCSVSNSSKNLNQESRGDVSMQGEKYVFNFMGITQIFDGDKIYTIVPEDEEISIESYNKDKINSLTPSKMLTFFNTGYNYAWDIMQNVKGRKIQYVKLTPTDAKNSIKQVLIGVDWQTKHIYNLIQIDKDGTKTTFTLISFKTNQPLSKNHFTFTESKYPNYYINRLD
ncbi:LolA family protein [Flavobacterium rhizosphaerae]|uniref:Outer membrane lipoprotein carrier protein LolA n=1 Tax=Flavobacterium rhizosphaerae TaxID=3163298 RepID=A0ABW8YV84_9FLAO